MLTLILSDLLQLSSSFAFLKKHELYLQDFNLFLVLQLDAQYNDFYGNMFQDIILPEDNAEEVNKSLDVYLPVYLIVNEFRLE